MKIVENKPLKKFVHKHLYDDQSPRAISGRLKYETKKLGYISKSGIHNYIRSVYGRRIEHYRKKRRQRRRKRQIKYGKLDGRTFIDKRPKHIEKRLYLGDTEAAFIVSGKRGNGILLVVIDRKTRTSFLERITVVNIPNVHRAFLKIKKCFPEMRTMTTDNDILLQKHKELENLLGVKIYFCNPYHSWEKGTVENTTNTSGKTFPKAAASLSTQDRLCTL